MSTPTQPLEEITSEEYLNRAFEDAKEWCERNLPYHLSGLAMGFDYTIFKHEIAAYEQEMASHGMRISDEKKGLIQVSVSKLKHLELREEQFKTNNKTRCTRLGYEKTPVKGSVEIDPESMFVREITEFVINRSFLLQFYCVYNLGLSNEEAAYMIENVNRKQRGLKPRPEF
jgi:hypothetical protein